jgi:hypothetical protein
VVNPEVVEEAEVEEEEVVVDALAEVANLEEVAEKAVEDVHAEVVAETDAPEKLYAEL